MSKYRLKDVQVEAITFNQLVEHGRAKGANIVDGMPWSFTYQGQSVTHENDACYLISTRRGLARFTPTDVLITEPSGDLRVIGAPDFLATYAPA